MTTLSWRLATRGARRRPPPGDANGMSSATATQTDPPAGRNLRSPPPLESGPRACHNDGSATSDASATVRSPRSVRSTAVEAAPTRTSTRYVRRRSDVVAIAIGTDGARCRAWWPYGTGSVSDVEKEVFHAVNDLPQALYPVLWPFQQLGVLVVGPDRGARGRDSCAAFASPPRSCSRRSRSSCWNGWSRTSSPGSDRAPRSVPTSSSAVT